MPESQKTESARRQKSGEIPGQADPNLQRRVEDYFWRYVPKGMLQRLSANNIQDVEPGRSIECKVSIAFMDVRSFTTMSENLSKEDTFDTINSLLRTAIPIIHEHGGMIDKFIGDAIMAIFPDKPDQAMLAINKILSQVPNLELPAALEHELKVGAGVNSGIVILGALGNHERMEITVLGDAVNLASRLESLNKTYRTSFLVSESTLYAVHEPAELQTRMIDRIRVKGKVRPQSIYEVFDSYPEEKRQSIIKTKYEFENALAHYHLGHVTEAYELIKKVISASPEDEVARMYLERCESYLRGADSESLRESRRNAPWQDSYNLSIPDVDAQHKRLLDLINEVSKLIWEDSQKDISSVLDSLQDYAIEHFETEARLMAHYEYPQMKEHVHEHNSFVGHFLNVRREIESGEHHKLYMLFKVDVFLMDWLLSHTTGSDKHWADYIKAHGYEHDSYKP